MIEEQDKIIEAQAAANTAWKEENAALRGKNPPAEFEQLTPVRADVTANYGL